MNHEGSSFLTGCAGHAEFLFFAKELDSLTQGGDLNSSFFMMEGPDWRKYDTAAAWPAISMATVKPVGGLRTVIAVGPNGQYWELAPLSLKQTMGLIDAAEFPVRAISSIGDDFYLCGMGRMVLRREDVGTWIDVGPNAPLIPDTVIGFEDIAGFSEQEIYAAGWQGEIWWRDQNRWRQVDSPVSMNLNALTCARDGHVYVVGDNGVMLRGRREQWEVLETGRTENLIDVAWHAGQIYVVTDFRILVLQGDVLIDEQNFAEADNRPATCLCLLPGSDAIFSMGPKDLFRLMDAGWERLV